MEPDRPPAEVQPRPAATAARDRPATPAPILQHSPDRAPEELVAFLEGGGVLQISDRPFDLEGAQALLFETTAAGGSKSVSYNPARRVLRGARLEGAEHDRLAGVLARYCDWSEALVRELLPHYAGALTRGKTSFRPRSADAPMSPRKDDRRLHVDAFPSQPVQGRRILRVFRNVHPGGRVREWQIGEPFEAFARRFLPAARRRPPPGAATLMQLVGLTKGRRTAYDDLMLQLHDAAKADDAYQAGAPRHDWAFPSGATWIVFSDATVHAALSGQHAFEQTFFLPVAAMRTPEAAPLRVLERLTGRRLV